MMITRMPVLNEILEMTKNKKIFKDTLFICNQHLLYTTIDLFDGLIYLGANPENILVVGKIYSNCNEVVNILSSKHINVVTNKPFEKTGKFQEYFEHDVKNLWFLAEEKLKRTKIANIIILDDGGFCLSHAPKSVVLKYPTIGIEQTTSGLTKIDMQHLEFPVIEVASSAAKQHVESPMIAQSVIEKLKNIIPINSKKLNCGVVGFGAIGKSFVEMLLTLGHSVYVYDKNTEKIISTERIKKASGINELIHGSDYIFGCSGEDIVTDIAENIVCENEKVFVSCSSQDKEFKSLLLEFEKRNSSSIKNPLSDIVFDAKNSFKIKILRGGFPINLDNSGYAVRPEDIQMTRGLLLFSLIQASMLVDNFSVEKIPSRIMLCPLFQQIAVKTWLKFEPQYALNKNFINKFSDIEWIKNNSRGEVFGLKDIAALFM